MREVVTLLHVFRGDHSPGATCGNTGFQVLLTKYGHILVTPPSPAPTLYFSICKNVPFGIENCSTNNG